MKRSPFLSTLVIALAFCSCGTSNEDSGIANPAEIIVKNSIVAHGGWDAWSQMKELKYSKRVIMYDSAGNIESETVQKHHYKFQPGLSGEITWTDNDENAIRITYDSTGAAKMINNVTQDDEASKQEANSTFLSSHYVLFQPWKLLDPGAKLKLLGKEELDKMTVVDVVELSFEGANEDADRWWFYFNEKSGLLEGYIVKHGDRLSFIRNESYNRTTNMVFPSHRFSHYVSDTKRSNPLLRAEYFYENFERRYSP